MNVIRPDVYDPASSLSQIVEKLSDRKNAVTDDTLINLVVKYFFAYIYPESIDQKISLDEINEKFAWARTYCEISRNTTNRVISNITPEEQKFYEGFQSAAYGLTMLWDISPTTVIIKDIINRQIDPTVFDGKYVWLDLGTGTGILLLAQCIQAIRNDFKSIQNIGIERDLRTTINTFNLAKKLWFGAVFAGDTTQQNIYNILNISGPVTFISNENIPTTWIAMNGCNDPFHQNNKILYQTSMKSKLSEFTQTFPSQIAMVLKLWPWFEKDIQWSHSNAFSIDGLTSFEDTIKRTPNMNLADDRSILDHVFVSGIEIENKIIPVHEVGKDLIQSGKVSKIKGRRHRRSDKSASTNTWNWVISK